MRFADPERLVGKKRRNELAAAETSLCYLTRGKFGERTRMTTASLIRAGSSSMEYVRHRNSVQACDGGGDGGGDAAGGDECCYRQRPPRGGGVGGTIR